jgi:hypothetical protein
MSAGSQQYTTSTSAATLIASVPAVTVREAAGWAYILNTDSANAIYVGGSNVSSSNGVQITHGNGLPVFLFSGNSLYAIAAAGTPVVAVLQTGT